MQVARDAIQVARGVGLLKQRPEKKMTAKLTLSVNDVSEHRSHTEDHWSDPELTLEVELSLWSRDQSQRTV